MTESEWLISCEPERMLAAVGGASDRKMRLFACAVARCLWELLPDRSSRAAVEVAERFADGQASFAELKFARLGAERARDAVARRRWGGVLARSETTDCGKRNGGPGRRSQDAQAQKKRREEHPFILA